MKKFFLTIYLIFLLLPFNAISEENLASFILRNYESHQLPVVGNTEAEFTIVEFFDYRCGYCSKQAKDYQKLLENNENVKIIYIEWPIFGDISNVASNLAILVWNNNPEKYFDVHNGLMNLGSRMKKDNIIPMLNDLGLDGKSLFEAGEKEVNKVTIESNFKLAKNLGLRGTPASIVNDSIYPGYVKYENLQSLLNQ